MCSTASVSAIRSTFGSEFIAHKMFAAGASVATVAENLYLVNKI